MAKRIKNVWKNLVYLKNIWNDSFYLFCCRKRRKGFDFKRFDCKHRGKLPAKNKGWIDMYFVEGIKKELSFKGHGRFPNDTFYKMYEYEKAKFQKLAMTD